jgi:hypothetical protein
VEIRKKILLINSNINICIALKLKQTGDIARELVLVQNISSHDSNGTDKVSNEVLVSIKTNSLKKTNKDNRKPMNKPKKSTIHGLQWIQLHGFESDQSQIQSELN